MRAGSDSARAADLQLTAFGTVLHLRQIPETLLQRCLLPDWQLERPDREPHVILECDARTGAPGSLRLLIEQKTVSRTPFTVENLLESLDQSLHLAIAEFSPQAIFVHAGVCVRNGAAVIVPGRSRAGKSTLIKALADAGATYYSDEFAPILPDGSVTLTRNRFRYASLAKAWTPPKRFRESRTGTLGWKSDLPPGADRDRCGGFLPPGRTPCTPHNHFQGGSHRPSSRQHGPDSEGAHSFIKEPRTGDPVREMPGRIPRGSIRFCARPPLSSGCRGFSVCHQQAHEVTLGRTDRFISRVFPQAEGVLDRF